MNKVTTKTAGKDMVATLIDNVDYLNSCLNGVVKTHYKSGQLLSVAHYKKGKLHGALKFYNESGDLHDVMYCINDKEVSKNKWVKYNSK